MGATLVAVRESGRSVTERAPARTNVLRRVRRATFVALAGFLVVGVALGWLVDGGWADQRTGGWALAVAAAVLGLVGAAVAAWVVAGSTAARVEAVFAQQDRLLRAATHELRTPLSWLQAVVEEGVGGTLESTEALAQAGAAAHEIHELIEDLVEAAEVLSGAIPLAQDLVELEAVAESIAGQGTATAATVVVESSPGAVAATVPGSVRLLRRAVSNLVRNAAAHGYEGGEGVILVEVGERGIAVVDTGVGVDDARLEALRAEVPLGIQAGRGGLGLGLALAGWVAAVHGGSLELDHHEPRGLRVAIVLPTDGLTNGHSDGEM